jgi:hypothetical protein
MLLAIGIFSVASVNSKKKPEIRSISPTIGAPGDEMTINGSGFGDERGTSYVEIAGSRITSGSYVYWSDEKIRLVLPPNVQDGLVFVSTSVGRTEPAFFANEKGIPVAVRENPTSTLPVISEISAEKARIGQKIVISGQNFGASRGNSKVYFTANREKSSSLFSEQNSDEQEKINTYIPASENEFDYISWSDTEISVKIPDGADGGAIFVETFHGSSQPQKIGVEFSCGKKQYANRRTYVVQVAADISNHVASQESSISLFIPRPVVSSFQPYAELNEVYPEPFVSDDEDCVIHKKKLNQIVNNKQRFSQTFVVSSYSVKGNLAAKNVPQTDSENPLAKKYLAKDECVPSDDAAVISLAGSICGAEKNPAIRAKKIYDYMTENYKISEKIRSGDISVLDLLKKKRGDAYDFAILFAALCRAGGIPAVPVAGIFVSDKSTVTPHWWTEIYFANYGWLPVDPAIGAGLNFPSFIEISNPREFYFGNLDNQHVAFSRGWHQIRQSSPNAKIVYRPRTYALQSVWEEAGDATSSYSSLWNNPVVLGIY